MTKKFILSLTAFLTGLLMMPQATLAAPNSSLMISYTNGRTATTAGYGYYTPSYSNYGSYGYGNTGYGSGYGVGYNNSSYGYRTPQCVCYTPVATYPTRYNGYQYSTYPYSGYHQGLNAYVYPNGMTSAYANYYQPSSLFYYNYSPKTTVKVNTPRDSYNYNANTTNSGIYDYNATTTSNSYNATTPVSYNATTNTQFDYNATTAGSGYNYNASTTGYGFDATTN